MQQKKNIDRPAALAQHTIRTSALRQLSGDVMALLGKMNQLLYQVDTSNLKPTIEIDFEDVFSRFAKVDIHTVDRFCEAYLNEVSEQGDALMSREEYTHNFRALRQFLYEKRRNGHFKYPFSG